MIFNAFFLRYIKINSVILLTCKNVHFHFLYSTFIQVRLMNMSHISPQPALSHARQRQHDLHSLKLVHGRSLKAAISSPENTAILKGSFEGTGIFAFTTGTKTFFLFFEYIPYKFASYLFDIIIVTVPSHLQQIALFHHGKTFRGGTTQ